MENQSHPKQSQRNDIAVNDVVYISHRFFVNHNIPQAFRQIGNGVVVEVQPPTTNTLPKIFVKFAYSAIFVNCAALYSLLITDNNKLKQLHIIGSHVAVISIHPVYLEKLIIRERKRRHA